ncbi:DUF4124 domain-containing protein [Porticoccus sp.]
MKHFSKVFGALLAMALCLPLHAGKIYKWQDEQGSWHYSEKPPLEEQVEVIKIKGKSAESAEPDSPAEEDALPSTTAEEKPKEPLKKSAEVLAVEKTRKAEDCQRARTNLDSLTHRTRILYDDEEKGEQRYLTEEERQEWLKKSQGQVKEFCD